MNIGIVGTGERAGALAHLLARKHDVRIGDARHPDRADEIARSIRNGAVLHPYQLVMTSDILILTMDWSEIDAELAAMGPVGETLVIDATNAAEQTKEPSSLLLMHKLNDPHVVKAFNALPPRVLRESAGQNICLFYACNDATDRRAIDALIGDAGFVPVHVGTLQQSGEIEPGGTRFERAVRRSEAA